MRKKKPSIADAIHFRLVFVILGAALLFFCFDTAQAADRELSLEELDRPVILLPPGTRVPDNLDNPDFWRDWIEEMRGTPLTEDFDSVAHLFKEEGEKLGIFWPAVLVQSVHETNFFRYGGRARMENFNAGGVGITPEEQTTTRQNFQTLRNGVRAMLEHVAVYADPYRMEKVIREQNNLELGVKRFTAKRTEEMFRFIRDKYDWFRTQWPNQPVRITDLGSWAPDEQVKQMKGYDEHGLTRQSIRGATLAYAEDPFYGAKLYRIWHRGASYVRGRYSDSQFTTSEAKFPYSLEAIRQAVLKISLWLLLPKFSI
jgi:hypothetical protein